MDAPNVLIAEDEPELRRLFVEAFEDSPIRAFGAADGVEALELLQANPSVALLLSDVRMPRMDGYTLAEHALAYNSELKILMMTAYAAEQPPSAILRAREVRTLRKPFDVGRMCELVKEMLGRP